MPRNGSGTYQLPAGQPVVTGTVISSSTFNTLTDSVARFEKEAAQRERLSSLGRLSSVVAHEIRNPLNAISLSLQNLRRQLQDGADAGPAAGERSGGQSDEWSGQ